MANEKEIKELAEHEESELNEHLLEVLHDCIKYKDYGYAVSRIRQAFKLSGYHKQDIKLSAISTEGVALLKETLDVLDKNNARYGYQSRLCFQCNSPGYNATEGIIHEDTCLIKRTRKYLAQLPNQGIKEE
jgi:hypothetical protein